MSQVRNSKHLIYARQPTSHLILTAAGDPIWPVYDDEEYRQLQQFAERRKLRLEKSTTYVIGRSAIRRRGVVVGLGLMDTRIAEIYAHLTQREVINLDDESGIDDQLDVAVVLMRADSLTSGLIERLYTRGRSTVAGMIFASTEATLHVVAKRFAASLLQSAPPDIDYAAFRYNQQVKSHGVIPDLIADTTSERDDVERVLGAGAGFLEVTAHSDGIHTLLSNALTLCPYPRGFDKKAASAMPYCVSSQVCTRFPDTPSIDHAWRYRTLIRLDTIKADLLFLIACGAVRIADRILDQQFSFSCALVEQADFSATVATWEWVEMSRKEVGEVFDSVRQGNSIGSVVQTLNAKTSTDEVTNKFCLIGDPDFTVPFNEDENLGQYKSRSQGAMPEVDIWEFEDFSDLALMVKCLESSRATNFYLDEDLAEEFEYMLQAVSAGQLSPSDAAAIHADFKQITLEFFSTYRKLFHAWKDHANERYVANGTCGYCSSRTQIISYTFGTKRQGERLLTICPCCGEVSDCPVDYPMGFDIDQLSRFQLKINGIPADATCHVNLVPQKFSDSTSIDWPMDGDARASQFDLADVPFPADMVTCKVLIAWDAKIAVLCVKLFRHSNGMLSHPLSARVHYNPVTWIATTSDA